MYKIAFIKFAGLAAGGTESFLQTVAANLPKDKFEVHYFYTNPAPYIGSDWVHPDNDPFREQYLLDHKVKLIKCRVGYKNVNDPIHTWIDTDFWDKYKENGPYDLIQTGRAGHPEYPFTHILDTPIVEAVTLAGMADNQNNIVKSMHCSRWAAEQWIKAGGDPSKIEIIPLIKDLPHNYQHLPSLRQELGIPDDAIVLGFHQRADDNIFSPIPLEAYAKIAKNNSNIFFIILGGSQSKYIQQAKSLGLQNFIQFTHTGDTKFIFRFLNTLNIYAHGRSDGETYGVVISEALACNLPIISHVAPCMGHVETIGPAGIIANDVDSYANAIFKTINSSRTSKSIEHYNKNLSVQAVLSKIVSIYENIITKNSRNN